MALVVTRLENLPPSTRNKKRALEDTEEWLQLKTKLAEGLKPYEVVYVTFTPEQQKELGVRTAGRIFRTMANEYIHKLGLQYDCWRYRSEGKEVVVVAGREVSGKAQVQAQPTLSSSSAHAPRVPTKKSAGAGSKRK